MFATSLHRIKKFDSTYRAFGYHCSLRQYDVISRQRWRLTGTLTEFLRPGPSSIGGPCSIRHSLLNDVIVREKVLTSGVKSEERKKRPVVVPYIRGYSEELKRIFGRFGVPTYFKSSNTLRQHCTTALYDSTVGTSERSSRERQSGWPSV